MDTKNFTTGDEGIRKAIIEFFELQDDNTTYSFVPKKDILAWLEKQGKPNTGEWKKGDIIKYGGVVALVIEGRRAMKFSGEVFTIQYPDEWVKVGSNEVEQFDDGIKAKAHQIAWETSKHYDPNSCKQEWCEMAALDMASWFKKQEGRKNTWKPTQEQMTALKIVKNGFPSDDLEAIESLYNDLKNL